MAVTTARTAPRPLRPGRYPFPFLAAEQISQPAQFTVAHIAVHDMCAIT